MTKTTVYVVRHGQTDWNKVHRTQGITGAPLNDLGIRQARQLREKMKHMPIDLFVSSPAPRALQTAKILARGRKIKVIDDFHERDAGVCEGLTREKLFKLIPDIQKQWDKDGIDWLPKNGETIRNFYNRSVKALKHIVETYPGQRTFVVAHGGILRSLVIFTLHRKPEEFFELRRPKNAEMVRIIHNGKSFHLKGFPNPFK